jgi:hypothetical protein
MSSSPPSGAGPDRVPVVLRRGRGPDRLVAPVLLTLAVLFSTSPACRREDARPRVAAPSSVAPRPDAAHADAAVVKAPVPRPTPAPRRPLPANLTPGQQIVLVHSANLRGEYDFHPLGGLGRRITFAAELAKSLPADGGVIDVDAGDSLLPKIVLAPGEPPPDPGEIERRARLLAAGLGRLHLGALVPGETDLQMGARKYKDLAQKNHLPVVAANLVDDKGKRLFDPHRIVKIGALQVGFVGLLTASDDDTRALTAAKLTLTDPLAAAQGAISALREKGVDVVVGLFHLGGGLAEARSLATALVGMDVLVLGHDPQLLEDPVVVGDASSTGTFIVSAGERGRFLGRMSLHLVDTDRGFAAARGSSGPVIGSWADHELVRMDPRFVSDPAMGGLTAAYIDENRKRAARKLPVGLTARAGTHGEVADSTTEDWTYATTAACALCHAKQKEQYDTTSHAFAMATLERKGRERDPYCLGCHSTGFDAPGGTRNLQTAIQYFGPTGCESCHGPSVTHVRGQTKKGTSRLVPETVCLRCHRNEHSPEPFDYAAGLKEILGPGHGQGD